MSTNVSAGVLTKMDIMDRGTDAAAVLRNEVVPLRLGHLGVVNRSQHDLNMHRSMAAARAAEAEFFASHPAYAEVRSLSTGVVCEKTRLLPLT